MPTGPSRPPARPSTRSSRHHLEHNPFEQSFSKPSDSPDDHGDDGEVDTPTKGGSSKTKGAKNREKADRAGSVGSTAATAATTGPAAGKQGQGAAESSSAKGAVPSTADKAGPRAGNSTPTSGKEAQTPSKRVLPPVSSMTSPSANESGSNHFPWNSTFSSSLRSGPLSPAMLAGPQSSFDPTTFRTGLTPDLSTFKTGLTPLGATGASFPPPSPNTAAFLAMVTNSNGSGLSGATITPNTLSALSGNPMDNVTNHSSAVTSQPSNLKQEDSQQQQQRSSQAQGSVDGRAQQQQHAQSQSRQGTANGKNDNPTQTTQAASGLFLLSQAHQELAKREDAAAAAQAAAHALHGIPRPNDSQQQALYSNQQQPHHNAFQAGGKGASNANRSTGTGKRKKTDGKGAAASANASGSKKVKSAKSEQGGSVASMSGDDLDDDGDMDDDSKGAGGPEDEEKRKNFLERNRQAALKCRQRKKAWLASLQAKVEYLQTDNEHLQGTVGALRNEIMFLKSQLLQTQRQLGASGPNANGDLSNGLVNGNPLTMNQAGTGAVAPGLGRNSMSGPVPISNGAPLGPGNISAGMVANPMPMTSMAGVSGASSSNMGLPNIGPGQYQAHAVPRPTHIPGQYTHSGPSQQQNSNHARQPSGGHQTGAVAHDRRGEAQVA